jgi:hypothetical protein
MREEGEGSIDDWWEASLKMIVRDLIFLAPD